MRLICEFDPLIKWTIINFTTSLVDSKFAWQWSVLQLPETDLTLSTWDDRIWLAWVILHSQHRFSWALKQTTIISFIHSFYFYSASSSLLLLRGATDTTWILCHSLMLKRHRQLQVKDLPKVPTCRLDGIRTYDHSDERRQIYQLATMRPCPTNKMTQYISEKHHIRFLLPGKFPLRPSSWNMPQMFTLSQHTSETSVVQSRVNWVVMAVLCNLSRYTQATIQLKFVMPA